MGNKPAFEEKEIEELCVLYANINYDIAVWEILTFLEKQLGYSKVSNVATEIRKEFVNKRCRDKQNKHQLNYPNSTLQLKLLKRIDFTESQNIIL